ncbi:hypothetical protein CJ260_10065 [Megasphaera sp. ASD88]|uniref:hypothetical protein n=1 Tax=Megasphaera sp. ASD88 TaxID=2027407 RepID=UPI000BABAFB9|nr:hypothetical protein [Megasphaera sp. ASD88]PAV38255.1 hypothetical protein CJ260_10065 [Megasphaera sp. ASD88]
MKKIIFCIMTLITVLVNISIISAISIDEIRANPSKYVLVHSGAQQEEYIDSDSICVIRYAPPFYAINATAYAVYYNQDNITVYHNTYTYDLNRSFEKLVIKYPDYDDFARQINLNTGITWRPQKLEIYHMNGTVRGNSVTIDPLEINMQSMCRYGSPSYNAANFVFYKAYNRYFNPNI